jgi:hypothetical protein
MSCGPNDRVQQGASPVAPSQQLGCLIQGLWAISQRYSVSGAGWIIAPMILSNAKVIKMRKYPGQSRVRGSRPDGKAADRLRKRIPEFVPAPRRARLAVRRFAV